MSEEAGNYIWRGGLFPAGKEETHKYTLTVIWPIGENDAMFMNEIDAISLRIDAYQVVPKAVTASK